jgi:hypothetical protein
MNVHEKKAAVLRAAEAMFASLEEKGDAPLILDAPRVLGVEVRLPPGEVAVILRGLHRAGRIGLVEGMIAGNTITIARSQSLLQMPHLVARNEGGRRVKLSRTRPSRAPSSPVVIEPEQETEPSIGLELREQIATLEVTVVALERELAKEEGRKDRANEKRAAAEARNRELEAMLSEARRAVCDLKQQVDTLQPEADKVPGLLRRITELEAEKAVPLRLAETIDRLTSNL